MSKKSVQVALNKVMLLFLPVNSILTPLVPNGTLAKLLLFGSKTSRFMCIVCLDFSVLSFLFLDNVYELMWQQGFVVAPLRN
jgi:hypothetical protein